MDGDARSERRSRLDAENPWPGLESYDESSQSFFSGRSTERDELLRRITDESVTVLFGKSGLGKTSLLKAGVFPRLRDKGFLPIPVRLLVRSDAGSFIEQVRRALFETLEREAIEYPKLEAQRTLWEYLHHSGLEFWTLQNRLVRPVLVFDQFEELFTLGKAVRAEVAKFSEDLADLAENRIPAETAERLENGGLDARELELQARPYKLVITLREDFLPDLEGLRLTMPSLRRNRMRLLPMGRDQALEAVRNPHTERLVPEPIARGIVDFLGSGAAASSDGSAAPEVVTDGVIAVEPALLSLFCRGVNEQRKRAGKPAFDEALLEGGKASIVADFYRSSLHDQPERARHFIEDELITEHGFRNSYSVEDALSHGFLTLQELTALVDRRLLRIDHYLGVERVELTHDILTKAVREERERRRELDRVEKAQRERSKLIGWVGGMGAVVVLLVGFAGWAFAQKGKAEKAQKEALEAKSNAEQEGQKTRSRGYAALGESILERDAGLALLLAQKGLSLADTVEAREALLQIAEYTWPEVIIGKEDLGGNPVAIVLSGDGTRLGVATENDVRLWNVSGESPTTLWPAARAGAGAKLLAFSSDQKLLAVAKLDRIVLFDANTGRLARPELLQSTLSPVIAFSPNGRWLASVGSESGGDSAKNSGSEGVLLWDLSTANPKPERISFANETPLELAVLDDEARSLVGVIGGNLSAYRVERRAGGKPHRLHVKKCLEPRSMSLGGARISATFKAKACEYAALGGGREGFGEAAELPLYDLAIDDVVWSARGNAFVATVPPSELVVGSDDRVHQSHMKGVNLRAIQNARGAISLSEDAMRLALIDEGGRIHVYSLGQKKPYMTRFGFVDSSIAPDGRWMAGWTFDDRKRFEIILLDAAFTPDALSLATSIVRPDGAGSGSPTATKTSLVFQPGADGATRIVDIRSKEVRTIPAPVQFLGVERELLFSIGPGGPSIVRASDLKEINWKRCADGTTSVKSNTNGQVLVVLCAQRKDSPLQTATVYGVRGESLAELGKVLDLSTDSEIAIANDGRSLVEIRTPPLQDAARGSRLVWPVNSGNAVSARDASRQIPDPEIKPQNGLKPIATSLLGGYLVWRTGRSESYELKTRTGEPVALHWHVQNPNFAFSNDERRLAVYGGPDLEVFEIGADAKPIATLRFDGGNVWAASLEAGGRLVSVVLNQGSQVRTVVVPLDAPLIQRFASWLIGRRTMTHEERCASDLDADKDCTLKPTLNALVPKAVPSAP